MSGEGDDVRSAQLEANLETITSLVQTVARQHQRQTRELLALLRLLEALHKEIRDGLFQESLPDNRQALYALLRDIETGGGWPYINRMRLQAFLSQLPAESEDDRYHQLND
ncbi:hypothetical protein [Thermocoleostomius sinensis]|jgi:hypothetical protein|uniref:Uncharacterized protein n=1 Tax=Thermocoleostomius sinensis A174 TaxID=2016057 RepID=A0A9E8ZC99_9CYAN|nr:hypothetical protein [Thermocoleostomius sinensis]WAL60609.1 hypothetical protein OXH18_01025 [Thermocoleostomius sinensis A174]